MGDEDYAHDSTSRPGLEEPLKEPPDKSTASVGNDILPHQMVEKIAFERAEDLAVSCRDSALTYSEFNKRANLLARHLLDLGLVPGCPVALLLNRSPQMLLSLLAILKAGGTYVPIDPAYPPERNQFILEDSGASILLTTSDLAHDIPFDKENLLLLDQEHAWSGLNDTNLDVPVASSSAAYIIYTSGSTGKPKGVAMSRRTLSTLLQWQSRDEHLGKRARTLQFTPISFDVSFTEIFSTWVTGGTLVIIDEDTRRAPSLLYDYLQQEEIERLYLPYVSLQLLATEAGSKRKSLDKLHDIVCSGEPLALTPDIRRLMISLPKCRLHNRYGMTECQDVTTFILPRNPDNWPWRVAPIGRPIAGAEIFLRDRDGNPVPDGDPGEIFIGGEAATNGYWKRPELTAERFIEDFESTSGKLYQTGDLARWLPEGGLSLMGREDDQIKISGYRVDLSEIEALLRSQSEVKEAVVVAVGEREQKRLSAHIVSESDAAIDSRTLANYLRRHVPAYMQPAHYIFLQELPLTPSGKIDRRALINRPMERPSAAGTVVGPRTAEEIILTEIWREALGIEEIGIHDNFIDLGGQSLQAMRILSLVERVFQTELSYRAVLGAVTIAEMAALIAQDLESH